MGTGAKEGIDYYFNEEGLMVLTEEYLKKGAHNHFVQRTSKQSSYHRLHD